MSCAAHHALATGAHSEPGLTICRDSTHRPAWQQVLVSPTVDVRSEFGHRNGEFVLNLYDYAGLEPVLLVLVLVRVFDGHFYSQDSLSGSISLRVYTRAVEGRVEYSCVVIFLVVADRLWWMLRWGRAAWTLIEVCPLMMIGTIPASLIRKFGCPWTWRQNTWM